MCVRPHILCRAHAKGDQVGVLRVCKQYAAGAMLTHTARDSRSSLKAVHYYAGLAASSCSIAAVAMLRSWGLQRRQLSSNVPAGDAEERCGEVPRAPLLRGAVLPLEPVLMAVPGCLVLLRPAATHRMKACTG